MSDLEMLRRWIVDFSWILAPLLALVLLGLGRLGAAWQNRRHSQAILSGFDDSTRGRVVLVQPAGRAGFAGKLDPAPEPFTHFTVAYRPGPRYDLLERLLRPRSAPPDRLEIRAALPQTPHQELQWRRGEIQGRAVGKTPGRALWTVRQLDFIGSEYATRGANPGALVHAFSNLQTRFDPLLYEVSLLADNQPQFTLALRGAGLNPAAIPPLVALVRSAGRAALLE